MKLSLCINNFNEEKNIRIPLDSAVYFVDEVIIVDGSSKDKTVEIAKSYGAKVKIFVVDNPRNFLTNKQRAIEKASGEWILQLDSDEALSEDLKREIATLLNCYIAKKQPNNVTMKPRHDGVKQFNNEIVGYYIPRKNFFLTKFLMKGGVYPDYVLRLYKKENAKFELKDIHENVKIINSNNQISRNKQISKFNNQNSNKFENSNLDVGNCLDSCDLEIGYLKNPILHYADPNFSRYLLRWDRYTSFDAEELAKSIQYPVFSIQNLLIGINYFIIKPIHWFLKTYFRHKGFMDGFPGFVFSLFSSIRFWVIYVKWWTIVNKKN